MHILNTHEPSYFEVRSTPPVGRSASLTKWSSLRPLLVTYVLTANTSTPSLTVHKPVRTELVCTSFCMTLPSLLAPSALWQGTLSPKVAAQIPITSRSDKQSSGAQSLRNTSRIAG